MSYDLMVFEASAAPLDRPAFMIWYRQQIQWAEEHPYNDPQVSSPALQRWFEEMIRHFPPIDGPLADPDSDDPRLTDHCIGTNVIYSAFAWSQAEEAHDKMRELAIKYQVGFFDVSDEEGELLFPEATSRAAPKSWWKFW